VVTREQSTEGGKAGSEVDTNLHQKVYYHKLGTSQEEDPLIFETPDEPTLIFGVEVTGRTSSTPSFPVAQRN
jgi:prolyl oligopeptidase